MAVISIALHNRLLEIARCELGASGDHILRAAAQHACGVPLEQISYAQFGQLLIEVERAARPVVGTERAEALAGNIDGLRAVADRAFSRRVSESLGEHLGPAAVPFLSNTCSKLGLAPDAIGRSERARLTEGIWPEANPFLGAEVAP